MTWFPVSALLWYLVCKILRHCGMIRFLKEAKQDYILESKPAKDHDRTNEKRVHCVLAMVW